jgi:hypothetical protein
MRPVSNKELKVRMEYLKLQRLRLLERYERQKLRDAFVEKNLKRIKDLKMDGWPRLMQMKDRLKWIDLVYEAKIAGVYSIGTANCDVIANLNRFAHQK